MSALKYRSEIDGLRFWAILPVILFHAGFQIARGGFIGVDIFFVISGYLITSIIISDYHQGKFSLVMFYERRARRILPALYAMVLTAIIAGWFTFRPRDYQDLLASAVATVFFASNVFSYLTTDYFSQDAQTIPLLHAWTLAVEEQYYVFAPLLLVALLRFRKRVLWTTLALLGLLSLALAHYLSLRSPTFNYFLIPTRAWELAAGSLAAVYLFYKGTPRKSLPNEIVAGIGFALILLSIFMMDENTPYPSLFTVVPVLGAVCIVLFATSGSLVQ
jgi:peptidoglycan/LPS O-acetylase OafA/YrhL